MALFPSVPYGRRVWGEYMGPSVIAAESAVHTSAVDSSALGGGVAVLGGAVLADPVVGNDDYAVLEQPPTAAPPSSTPVLYLELAIVRQRYLTLSRALSGIALHYAVKANPDPAVLRTLAALGCRWDVASPGEIDAVLAAGGRPADMSYGNTIKKTADIGYAVRCGVDRFTVDSPGELAKITAVAPGATVLVRLATTGLGADWSLGGKFGCSEDEAAALLISGHRAGHPMGLAFHVGSQQRDPLAWDAPLAAAARLQAILQAAGGRLAVVDLGGGFPARMWAAHRATMPTAWPSGPPSVSISGSRCRN